MAHAVKVYWLTCGMWRAKLVLKWQNSQNYNFGWLIKFAWQYIAHLHDSTLLSFVLDNAQNNPPSVSRRKFWWDCVFCANLHDWVCFSRVPAQNGVSQAWYIVEIHHSGGKPSVLCLLHTAFSYFSSMFVAHTGVLTVFAHHRFANKSDGGRIITSSLFARLANQYFGINEQSVTNKSFRNTRLSGRLHYEP